MPKYFYNLALFLLLVFTCVASASSFTNMYTPGTSYYFEDFDPRQKPWNPGQFLNIEEVFKNYQYFEIIFDQDGRGITVYRYLGGSKEGPEKYLLLPDQSLVKQ